MKSNFRRQWIPVRSWFIYNTWFSLLVIGVSSGTRMGVPIGKAAWPILSICTGLAIVLAIKSRAIIRNRTSGWRPIIASAVILAAVVIVLWGSLFKGEFVSVFPDPWAYTAFATYVQNPMPAVGAGLEPIMSTGRDLLKARYGTAGLLALVSEVSGIDTCRSATIYAVFVFIHTGLGFALLARLFGAGRILSICAGVFGVGIGWAPEILKIGNWDQGLFLSFIPFVLARIRLSTFGTSKMSGIMALGLCLGAAIFVYPEGLAMAGVIYLPPVVWRLLRGRDLLGKLRRMSIAAGVALLVSCVYLPMFIVFLGGQIYFGTNKFSAKGVLPGLLSERWLPSFYGLGEQASRPGLKTTELMVPLLFVALSFVALGYWWRKKDGILLTTPVFLLLTLWQVILVKYDYGFYKILTMLWPVLVIAIFVGMSRLLAWSPPGLVRLMVAIAYFGVLGAAVSVECVNFQYAPWRAERQIAPFLELASLKRISGNAPILIVTQSWFNQTWAVYFLQGCKLLIAHPWIFLQRVSRGLDDVASEQVGGAVLLTDEKRTGAVWRNEIFSLMSHLDPVELLGIDAPNRIESVDGGAFIWLNNQFTDLTIRSDANREAVLNISGCLPGPSRPGDKFRTLVVEVSGARAELPALSNMKVPIKLKQGANLVRLSCKETPTVDKLPSGDTRALLLGIKGFSVAVREPVELSAIDAPNEVETVQGDRFIWLDNQFADFEIDSDADRQASFMIRECWPGPSRSGDPKRTLIVEVNGIKTEVTAGPNLKVPLNLHQGSNLVKLSCKETPTIAKPSSGDARTLLLGIKAFSVTATE